LPALYAPTFLVTNVKDMIEEGKRSGASPHGCTRNGAHGSGESYIPCIKETVGSLRLEAHVPSRHPPEYPVTRMGHYQRSQISPENTWGNKKLVWTCIHCIVLAIFLFYIRHPCFGNRLLCDVNRFEKQPKASSSYIILMVGNGKTDQSRESTSHLFAPALPAKIRIKSRTCLQAGEHQR
jgi:hypothetical protein